MLVIGRKETLKAGVTFKADQFLVTGAMGLDILVRHTYSRFIKNLLPAIVGRFLIQPFGRSVLVLKMEPHSTLFKMFNCYFDLIFLFLAGICHTHT